VPDPETFPQFKDGMPKDELDLSEVRVDTWGGWLWFNLDGKPEPLLDFLKPLPAHIAPYEMQDMRM
jgi:phenylpropionate dioxygenase-like ring-hydroxylating dioxygenase large terminal subunit